MDEAALFAEMRRRFAALDYRTSPHPRLPPRRWQQFITDCAIAFDGEHQWALLALTLGWEPLQLFGLDRYAPYTRVDHQGVLWLVNGARIEDMDERGCTILVGSADKTARLTYLRHPMPSAECILPWEFGP
jgi:hypothetical protein